MMPYFGRLLTCDREAITIRVDMDGTCWISDTSIELYIDKVYLHALTASQPARRLTYTSKSSELVVVAQVDLEDNFSRFTSCAACAAEPIPRKAFCSSCSP